jgi:membrane fusion protein, multidrug efflux system
MKQIQNFTIAFIFAAAILSSCSQGEKTEETTSADASQQRKEVVRVMELQPQTITRSVEYPANLEAYEEVHMVPSSPGRIEAIFADVGDRVSKGDLLIQMDRTQLHQAKVQLKNTKADLERLDTLAKTQSIPQQQYDQLKTQYDVAKSNVAFLSENTQLPAPFNGVISGRYFEPGEMYSGTPNTQAGKAAVLSIVRINRLKAMVELSEKYFPQIQTDTEITIDVDVYPGHTFSGRVKRIHPTIDPVNRTFDVEILIDNQKKLLRPGMFARVTFALDQVEAILVPAIAVLKMQGSNERYLFTDDNGKAQRISVTIGERYDEKIEVFSEKLKPGARIVVSGQARLIEGVPLEIKN